MVGGFGLDGECVWFAEEGRDPAGVSDLRKGAVPGGEVSSGEALLPQGLLQVLHLRQAPGVNANLASG